MEKLSHKRINVKGRIWLQAEEIKFLGPGRIELLELIKQEGSISKAAKLKGISHRKAWMLINEMNTVSVEPLVITRKGGQSGGGAHVTQTADLLIEHFKGLYVRYHAFLGREQKSFDHLLSIIEQRK